MIHNETVLYSYVQGHMFYYFAREKHLPKTEYGGTCKITDGQSPSWRSPSIVLRCCRKRSYMSLRFKSAGVVRSNGKQSWRVSYEEAIADNIKYWWAEDYEI